MAAERRPGGVPPSRWISRVSARHDLDLLREPQLARLRDSGVPRGVAAGVVLAAAGSSVASVLVILAGEVELLTRLPEGGRVAMAIVRKGGVIGDIPLLLRTPMPFDAVTRKPTWVIDVREEEWTELLTSSKELCLPWMASIARRLDSDRRRFAIITRRRLDAQVAYALLEEQESDGQRQVVRLTHSTIAELLGARRQSVTQAVGRLRARGLVESHYGETVLRDVPALRALVGPEESS